jgi:deoxyribodipyrimidine photo-lyase
VKHGSRIFHKHGTAGKRVEWVRDEALFERWRDGKTGMPLVDANMRELKLTGGLSCICLPGCTVGQTLYQPPLFLCC